MDGEVVKVVSVKQVSPQGGSAGIRSHVPGVCTTVSSVSAATGGIGGGKLMESDTK